MSQWFIRLVEIMEFISTKVHFHLGKLQYSNMPLRDGNIVSESPVKK